MHTCKHNIWNAIEQYSVRCNFFSTWKLCLYSSNRNCISCRFGSDIKYCFHTNRYYKLYDNVSKCFDQCNTRNSYNYRKYIRCGYPYIDCYLYPTDTITYTPTLTWTPNPLASIVYGTPLSITQLDATATYNGQTVPGNFVYTDPIGTAETSGNGGIVQNLITVTPNVQNAALAIVKSAYPTRYDDAGQTITYHYTVTNSGNADISAPITVVDDNFGTVPIQNSGILVQVQA